MVDIVARSDSGISLTDTVLINSVVWIRSLDEDELNPSRRMIEDLIPMAAAGHFAFEEKVVTSRTELLVLLDAVASAAQAGLRPILHFDCHGSAAEGIFLKPANEFCDWAELTARLRIINVATANNLCCVFAACFGMWHATHLRLSQPAPWYLVIAPENEISVGVLEERTADFYREVFASANITQAYERVLKPDLDLMLCKKVFAESLTRHIAVNCIGSQGRKRREEAVTAVLRGRGISSPTREQLAQARRDVKHRFQASQWVIDHFARTFLIGREPGIDVADLARLADNYARRERRHRERAKKQQH
ncbi:hypothetical protein FHS31_002972 [Sphingomonas vulcanisoli]|uniref:Uncharacterized protein n=1 Tax=Sphingomonas vulcanisoli TaxID=1658060 RepID=A0ABX0U013_9SPHN|nr:hypothetical protein [Sphingomonas vulcanisoli]NIJ09340.1 hypothetical protein [Sphingomonas vulcanisoli]